MTNVPSRRCATIGLNPSTSCWPSNTTGTITTARSGRVQRTAANAPRPFSRNFRFSSQQAHTIYPLSTDSSTIFLFVWAQGTGKGSVCPNAGPTTVDHGLPISFCQDSPPSPFGSGSISPLPQPQLSRRKRQPGDALEHTAKQPFRQVALRQQQPVIAGMFHQPAARLHQPLL